MNNDNSLAASVAKVLSSNTINNKEEKMGEENRMEEANNLNTKIDELSKFMEEANDVLAKSKDVSLPKRVRRNYTKKLKKLAKDNKKLLQHMV